MPLNRAALKMMLVRHEGCVLHAYQDHLGYWTLGVGRLIDERRGGGISVAEAMMLLDNDIARIEAALDDELPWWRDLDEQRQQVLAAMAFQLGVAGLLEFRNTLAAVKDRRWADAALGMRRSKWYRQTPRRAEEMAAMMEGQTEV